MNVILWAVLILIPTFSCASVALWFFGVRPYIHRHGRACITAVNWGYSIWADLTTAYEIGKKAGRFPLCVKWLFALQVIDLLVFFLALLSALLT
jgi:hypothetical protein